MTKDIRYVYMALGKDPVTGERIAAKEAKGNDTPIFSEESLAEIRKRSMQGGINTLAAASICPLTVIMQNMLTQKILPGNTAKSYVDLARAMSTREAFSGVVPFTARQAIGSGIGYTGTDTLAGSIASPLPYMLQPFMAGGMMGVLEAAFTAKAEQAELKAMLNLAHTPKFGTVFRGAALRNSFGWSAGEVARRMCENNNISPEMSFWVGIGIGGAAGIASMPVHQALTNAARDGGGIAKSLLETAMSGRAAFAGSVPRAVNIGAYTAAATVADRILARINNSSEKGEGRG